MIYHTFSFQNLPAYQLVPYLNHFMEQESSSLLPWHVCWLNNDSEQVIGLLPKTSWTAYKNVLLQSKSMSTTPSLNIEILKTSRQVPSDEIDAYQQSNLKNPNLTSKLESTSNDNKAPSATIANTINSRSVNYSIEYKKWIEELIGYCKSNVNLGQNSSLNLAGQAEDQALADSDTFRSGLMGFIGYDIGAQALAVGSKIEIAEQPCGFLAHYDIYLKPYTDKSGPDIKWALHTEDNTPQILQDSMVAYLQAFEAQLTVLLTQSVTFPSTPPALPLKPVWNFEQYTQAFNKTQQYLHQGDSYQINLTQKWQGQLSLSTFTPNDTLTHCKPCLRLVDYLPQLHHKTQAPFAGYLGITNMAPTAKKQGISEFELLSCSPELFVLFNKNAEGQQQIITKPIKGTLPRGVNAEQDEQLKQQLAMSDKDKAENVMIVDLLRNDLGKYAEIGSVNVPKLFAIESFSNVHHMVSTITATIKEEHHPLTVLFNSLPAGSITGTPKKRAVEIISELEVAPRGAYCGTLGYMNFDGTGQWNVLIRSLQADSQGKVALWAGGGITVGSECSAEYQECHDKVGNLVAVLDPE